MQGQKTHRDDVRTRRKERSRKRQGRLKAIGMKKEQWEDQGSVTHREG